MKTVVLSRRSAFAGWRKAARQALKLNIAPEELLWCVSDASPSLFNEPLAEVPHDVMPAFSVPKPFISLAEAVSCHSEPQAFAVLYRLLWRLQHQPLLLQQRADRDVHAVFAMDKSVRRDCHKMTAFVRFREASDTNSARRQFIAWFEPDHYIVERTAPFFVRRFADMDWVIATPLATACFADGNLSFSYQRSTPLRSGDATEELWRAYYQNIFNPARLKVKAMQAEMPKKYWKNLPEAALIPSLIATAEQRASDMRNRLASLPPPHAHKIKAPSVVLPVEPSAPAESLDELNAQARHCTRCSLHCRATQTVCGEGRAGASIMLVGEQPGDQEDLAGKPFVGPAGKILHDALRHAGIERERLYITNAVKHFKFTPRGKIRLHQRPNGEEIARCRWWLKQEIELVQPQLLVAMGATAAQSVTGEGRRILARRGKIERYNGLPPVLVTIHPSAIPRARDDAAKGAMEADFLRDIMQLTQIEETSKAA